MNGPLVLLIVLSSLIVFGFIATMRFLEIYKHQKLGDDSGNSSGKSLGTGELRGLIQGAMLDAIQPVEERLDRMEMALRQLPKSGNESKDPSEPVLGESMED